MTDSTSTERRKIHGLGRGLSALLGDINAPGSAGSAEARAGSLMVSIADLAPNPRQPRRHFDPDALKELAESLKGQGILQPLLVRAVAGASNRYEIIAGERRWRAAQLAQLHEVPVLVRELTDSQVLEIGLIENIQRRDLNAIEEAEGFHRLIEEFGHTQDAVGKLVGKSRSHVANLLRLLELPHDVRQMLIEGVLTMGHARALITSPDPAALAREVVSRGLSVRQTEQLAKGGRNEAAPARRRDATRGKDADTQALERDLGAALDGMAVEIDDRGGSGTVIIRYASLDQLDALCGRLTGNRGF